MTNLLRNGGFEADWGEDKSHQVLVCRPGQTPTEEVRDNIFTPSGGWLTWFYHTPDAPDPNRFDQPEVRDAWRSGDPRRVHSGEKATLLFTFWRKHDAGFLQQVTVTPGQRLQLKVWAHAWSNWNEGPHPDDPRWSEGAHVGRAIVALKEGAQELDDADRNFTFSVGIDPTGGTDPLVDTVVWGDGWHIYNGYTRELTVEATAEASTVTVFLRSKTLYSFKHNDAYFDDVTLTVIDQPEPPPPVYKCVTLVLPQDATRSQLAEILTIAYPDRRSFMFSHDDAGRLGGKAILYNILDVDKPKYIEWYAIKYPQTTVKFAYTSDWDDKLLIGQCDEPWGPQHYGNGGGPTYCAKGCWICDCAMALRYLGLDADATPLTVDAAVGHDGYDADYAMTWAAMSRLGLKVLDSTTNDVVARAHLDAGGVCFAEVAPTSLQHFVMVTKYERERYWMYDPWKRVACWVDEKYNGVESWRLVQPAQPPPPPSTATIVSFQQQRAGEYRDQFISKVQPPAWLLIGGFEEARHLKSLAPDMEVAIRHVDNDWKSYLMASDKDRAAERWITHYGQTLFDQAEYISYALDLNEYIATNDYETLRETPFWIEALVERFEKEGWPARIIGLNVPVGNPQHNYLCDEQGIPRQIPMLLPAVQLLTDNNCKIAYHSYWGIRKLSSGNYYSTLDEPASVRMHYAFRALLSWDPVFTAAGVYPQYAFTEGGPIYINEAGMMTNAHAGWKYKHTFDNDVEACAQSYVQFQDLVQEWNATHGNRARWLAGFLHGGFDEWRYFDAAGDLSRLLADLLTT